MTSRVGNSRRFHRRAPSREPYDTVLIVCEGEKTEPFYFKGLCGRYRLSSANIQIMPADGSDPMSVVDFALQRVNEYDRAYCVFDRNGHQNYAAALQRVANSPAGRIGKLYAITSVPCFELWLLLHFVYTTRSYTSVGSKSAGERILRDLKVHYPTYEKKAETAFEDTCSQLQKAIRHARQLTAYNVNTGNENPATKVHLLVDYLVRLKS